MLIISRRDVIDLLPMKACIDVMETALKDLVRGESTQHLRSILPLEEGSVFGMMPGSLKNQNIAGAKIITICPDNHQTGLPSHQGVVTIFDATNGKVKAILDAEAITAIRTAAVSAVATKVLAREDAKVLGMIGTGEQARSHLEAMLLIRPIQLIKVWGPNRINLLSYRDEMTARFSVPIEVCESARDAVQDADILCTLTSSKVPVVKGDWVKPGAHVNAVGACRPNERELDTALVKASRFFVDRMESAVHESGDYLLPLSEGAIDEGHIIGELGDLLLGNMKGRTEERTEVRTEEPCITVFKSLGLAIEDLAAADFIVQEAAHQNRGIEVDF